MNALVVLALAFAAVIVTGTAVAWLYDALEARLPVLRSTPYGCSTRRLGVRNGSRGGVRGGERGTRRDVGRALRPAGVVAGERGWLVPGSGAR